MGRHISFLQKLISILLQSAKVQRDCKDRKAQMLRQMGVILSIVNEQGRDESN